MDLRSVHSRHGSSCSTAIVKEDALRAQLAASWGTAGTAQAAGAGQQLPPLLQLGSSGFWEGSGSERMLGAGQELPLCANQPSACASPPLPCQKPPLGVQGVRDGSERVIGGSGKVVEGGRFEEVGAGGEGRLGFFKDSGQHAGQHREASMAAGGQGVATGSHSAVGVQGSRSGNPNQTGLPLNHAPQCTVPGSTGQGTVTSRGSKGGNYHSGPGGSRGGSPGAGGSMGGSGGSGGVGGSSRGSNEDDGSGKSSGGEGSSGSEGSNGLVGGSEGGGRGAGTPHGGSENFVVVSSDLGSSCTEAALKLPGSCPAASPTRSYGLKGPGMGPHGLHGEVERAPAGSAPGVCPALPVCAVVHYVYSWCVCHALSYDLPFFS